MRRWGEGREQCQNRLKVAKSPMERGEGGAIETEKRDIMRAGFLERTVRRVLLRTKGGGLERTGKREASGAGMGGGRCSWER